MPAVRRATHAGSWYSGQGAELAKQISGWMEQARSSEGEANGATAQHARAVIAPHAGYRYCGHVMAYAYSRIQPAQVRRIFLLGPSHHHYSKHCLLSPAQQYETPLGNIPIDADVYAELAATGKFNTMKSDVDEAEHSLELHLPYIVASMAGLPFSLVPIMVGALSAEAEAAYGRLLAPYLDDPANLFVVSSDFCHWGSRFSYTFHQPARGPIHASVEWVDREGMTIIERQDAAGFQQYLQQYGNTICGRHPIALFLHALQHCSVRHSVQFTKYDQSQRCISPSESSVSYASAVVAVQR